MPRFPASPARLLHYAWQVDAMVRFLAHVTVTTVLSVLVLAGLTFVLSPSLNAQGTERFSALAVNMNNTTGNAAARVDITINAWTTDAERDRLLAAAKAPTPALLEALQKAAVVGKISTPGNVGYDLRYARQLPGDDGGRRVVIATDRPVGFGELKFQSRTMDYPFMLIELRLDKSGEGEGRLLTATKISASPAGLLMIENYEAEPVRLQDVRKVN